ncbi:MAG: sigma-70 family RNA polymerase sigma factor [Nitrospirae bacterium]|nr:sigma-70 family RNA polymerase sigma factor [Nitrospirota bacterium]
MEIQRDEYALIKECVDGNAEAYAVLVDRYKDMIYNIAYRMLGDADTAHDMAQESFISAYAGLKKFKNDSKFSTWLYSIAVNKCRDHLRGKRPHVPIDEIAEVACSAANPEEGLQSRQMLDGIQNALNALPDNYREAIILKHIEGLDYKEMGTIIGIDAGTLKVRTHRGREMLKKLLKGTGVFDGQR